MYSINACLINKLSKFIEYCYKVGQRKRLLENTQKLSYNTVLNISRKYISELGKIHIKLS